MPDSGEWRKLISYLESTGVPFRAVSTYRPGAITATGRPSRHGQGLAVDFAGPTASRDSPQLLRINEAFRPIGHLLHELIYSGPGSVQFYNGQPHYYSGVTRSNHHDHVHVSIDFGTVLPTFVQEDEMAAWSDAEVDAHLQRLDNIQNAQTEIRKQNDITNSLLERILAELEKT